MTPKAVTKWSSILGNAFEHTKWSKYCSLPFTITMEAKLREFQYRVLQRYVTTNYYLKKMKMKESDICDFCGSEPETIRHLFFYCPIAHKLWKDLMEWLYPNFILVNSLSINIVLFGIHTVSSDLDLFNMILLITKRYIFVCKCKKELPCITSLVRNIKLYYEIETQISTHTKRNLLKKKWHPLSTKLT